VIEMDDLDRTGRRGREKGLLRNRGGTYNDSIEIRKRIKLIRLEFITTFFDSLLPRRPKFLPEAILLLREFGEGVKAPGRSC
jgi:hypothetical protein